jgi:hypothetical protein
MIRYAHTGTVAATCCSNAVVQYYYTQRNEAAGGSLRCLASQRLPRTGSFPSGSPPSRTDVPLCSPTVLASRPHANVACTATQLRQTLRYCAGEGAESRPGEP